MHSQKNQVEVATALSRSSEPPLPAALKFERGCETSLEEGKGKIK